MRRTISLCLAFILWLGVAAPCADSALQWAQTLQDIDDLAEHNAAMADLIRPQKVLIAPSEGCFLEEQICTRFEAAFKIRLEKMQPSVQFIEREEVAAAIKKLGFMNLDVYNNSVLGQAASEAGAEIHITETLKWDKENYELTTEVFDVKKNESIVRLSLKVPGSLPDPKDRPFVIKDPDSGLSMIVGGGETSGTSVFQGPQCVHCPDPKYTDAARKAKIRGTLYLVLTITEQGVPQDIRVAKSIEPTLDAQAVEAVRSWQLKPALGLDGKPLAVRTHIEITFNLS